MAFLYKIQKLILILFVVLTLIVATWVIGYKFLIPQEVYAWNNRYMLFGNRNTEPVFENVGPIFKYQPNTKILSTTYYDVQGNWIQEYSYQIPTNNLGLVQSENIYSNRKSLLLLGNSYTEGQGATPWFDSLQKKIETSLQLVNGGIFGTGFAQWEVMLDHILSKKIDVQYVVVIFISDDYTRLISNIPTQTLACLSDYQKCTGGEGNYGMPPDAVKLGFLEKLRSYRVKSTQAANPKIPSYMDNYFPASMLIFNYFKNGFVFENSQPINKMDQSDKAIESLINKYQQNIIFIHLPQKDEVIYKRVNPAGSLARSTILNYGGQLIDGFKACGLNRLDYFSNDGHPNEAGYSKIEECVRRSIPSQWLH